MSCEDHKLNAQLQEYSGFLFLKWLFIGTQKKYSKDNEVDADTITWIFLAGGSILMVLELVLPGGLAFFLGFSGVIVGILRWLGIVSDPGISVTAWLLLAVGLTVAIRPFIKKYFKGESDFKTADEDVEAAGQIVDVIEQVSSENENGRIRYNGITWQARALEGVIPAGTKARISYRESTIWIVEPVDEISRLENRTLQT